VLDVRVRQGAELSTDHHLVVCSLRISKPVPSRKSLKSTATYRIKWEALEAKEVRKQFASSITAEAFFIKHAAGIRKLKAIKFFWKRKHFEERGWKRKQTRKRPTLYGAGSKSKNILLLPHSWSQWTVSASFAWNLFECFGQI